VLERAMTFEGENGMSSSTAQVRTCVCVW